MPDRAIKPDADLAQVILDAIAALEAPLNDWNDIDDDRMESLRNARRAYNVLLTATITKRETSDA